MILALMYYYLVEEEHVIERRLRFEASMQMRAIYQEKQKQCQAFREAEKQRRFDSANKAEICQLHGIVANSRARGKYGLSKYRHSRMVRLYCQAAVTIQRAYRRMRQLRHDKSTEMQTLEALGERREKAVKIIQKAWKSYSQWKMREAMNFVSIMTGPVLDIGRRLEQVPVHLHSYQRGIAITGMYIDTIVGRTKTLKLFMGINFMKIIFFVISVSVMMNNYHT